MSLKRLIQYTAQILGVFVLLSMSLVHAATPLDIDSTPQKLTVYGIVDTDDGTDDVKLNLDSSIFDTQTVTASIYSVNDDDEKVTLWSEAQDILIINNKFYMELGSDTDNPFTDFMFSSPNVALSLEMNGQEMDDLDLVTRGFSIQSHSSDYAKNFVAPSPIHIHYDEGYVKVGDRAEDLVTETNDWNPSTENTSLWVDGSLKASAFLGDGSQLSNLKIYNWYMANDDDQYTLKDNVGIGVTDPTSTLDVSGNVLIDGNLNIGATINITELVGSGNYLYNLNIDEVNTFNIYPSLLRGSYPNITGVGTMNSGTWYADEIQDDYIADDLTLENSIFVSPKIDGELVMDDDTLFYSPVYDITVDSTKFTISDEGHLSSNSLIVGGINIEDEVFGGSISADDPFLIQNDDTELHIGAGAVGIGTDTFTGALNIDGELRVGGIDQDTLDDWESGIGVSNGTISFEPRHGHPIAYVDDEVVNLSLSSSFYYISGKSNDPDAVEAVYVTSSGNTGIHTQDSRHDLEVNGIFATKGTQGRTEDLDDVKDSPLLHWNGYIKGLFMTDNSSWDHTDIEDNIVAAGLKYKHLDYFLIFGDNLDLPDIDNTIYVWGGYGHTIGTNMYSKNNLDHYAIMLNGYENTILGENINSFIGTGRNNYLKNRDSQLLNGEDNYISGSYNQILGGKNQRIDDLANFSVILAGSDNELNDDASGSYPDKSAAMGYNTSAKSNTFIWGGTDDATPFESAINNTFLIRTGGVGINTAPSYTLDVDGTISANAFVGNGSGIDAGEFNVDVVAGYSSSGTIAANSIYQSRDDGYFLENSIASSSILDASISTDDFYPNILSSEWLAPNSISAEDFQSRVIDTHKFATNAPINSQHIKDRSISADDLAENSVWEILDGSLQSEDFAADTIGADLIPSSEITTREILNGTILAEDIATSAVTTVEILDYSILSDDFAIGAVLSTHVLDNDVESSDILDGTITSKDIAEKTTSREIKDKGIQSIDFANDSIITNLLKDNDVHSDDIKNGDILADDIATSAITTVEILDRGLNTVDFAEGSVLSTHILDNDVRSIDILDGTITSRDIAEKITSREIKDKGIQTVDVAADSINTRILLDNDVHSDDIKNGGILADDIATSAVTTVEILDRGLQTSDFSLRSILSALIQDNDVESSDIADRTITPIELANPIRTRELLDKNIQTIDFAADSINTRILLDNDVHSDDINDQSIVSADIADTTITSIEILDQSIVSQDIVDNGISSLNIKTAAVSSDEILDQTIVSDDIKTASLSTENLYSYSYAQNYLPEGGLTTLQITNESIVSLNMAAGSVASIDILDGTIINEDFADDAIRSSDIKDQSISSENLVTDDIESWHILDDGIQSEDFLTGGVSSFNILDGTIIKDDIKPSGIFTAQIKNAGIMADDIDDAVLVEHLFADDIPFEKVETFDLAHGGTNKSNFSNSKLVYMGSSSLTGGAYFDGSLGLGWSVAYDKIHTNGDSRIEDGVLFFDDSGDMGHLQHADSGFFFQTGSTVDDDPSHADAAVQVGQRSYLDFMNVYNPSNGRHFSTTPLMVVDGSIKAKTVFSTTQTVVMADDGTTTVDWDSGQHAFVTPTFASTSSTPVISLDNPPDNDSAHMTIVFVYDDQAVNANDITISTADSSLIEWANSSIPDFTKTSANAISDAYLINFYYDEDAETYYGSYHQFPMTSEYDF